MGQPFPTVLWVLTELDVLSPYEPTIPLPGIYPKEVITYIYTKTYTQMFIAALLTTAKTRKHPKCPLDGEWVNRGPARQWSIIQQYKPSKTRRNLKCVSSLSQRNQSEWFQLCDIVERAKWRSSFQELGAEGDARAEHRGCLGQGKLSGMILPWRVWSLHTDLSFVKTHRMYNTRVNPDENDSDHAVPVLVHRWWQTCHVPWRGAHGGGRAYVGVYGKSLYFLLNLSTNLTLL